MELELHFLENHTLPPIATVIAQTGDDGILVTGTRGAADQRWSLVRYGFKAALLGLDVQ